MLLLVVSPTLFAQPAEEVSFLRNIHIKQGAKSSDAVCIGCSITVEGRLDGDAIAIAGDIMVAGGK